MISKSQVVKATSGFLFCMIVLASSATCEASGKPSRALLEGVKNWFYFLDVNLDKTIVDRIAGSTYDMVVIDTIFTEKQNTDFPIREVIRKLKSNRPGRLVLAYVDIGQAEEWRTYWQNGWEIGNPSWIVANDPDGWEGNYPVAYWHPEWQGIWIGENGYIKQIINSGFDGIYLDWIEAYSDESVVTAAAIDEKNPEIEMIRWVKKLGDTGRSIDKNFLVIGQNAAELVENADYEKSIDAIVQEQTWFDGAADNNPPGDCPLPRTESDIDSPAYYNSLSIECKKQYSDYPDSTLHVSSESYLHYLQQYNIPVFTVDYAVLPANIDWIYNISRDLGFVPFVSERALGKYVDPRP